MSVNIEENGNLKLSTGNIVFYEGENVKNIQENLKKTFGENIETMTETLQKYNQDGSAIKGQKWTKTFDVCAIEYRFDRDKFSALKFDLEKDGKAMAFRVMYNDCGELIWACFTTTKQW